MNKESYHQTEADIFKNMVQVAISNRGIPSLNI